MMERRWKTKTAAETEYNEHWRHRLWRYTRAFAYICSLCIMCWRADKSWSTPRIELEMNIEFIDQGHFPQTRSSNRFKSTSGPGVATMHATPLPMLFNSFGMLSSPTWAEAAVDFNERAWDRPWRASWTLARFAPGAYALLSSRLSTTSMPRVISPVLQDGKPYVHQQEKSALQVCIPFHIKYPSSGFPTPFQQRYSVFDFFSNWWILYRTPDSCDVM